MKFKKILTIGIEKELLDINSWEKLDSLAEKRVSLSKDSSEIKNHLVDTDCLLVNPFVFKVEKDIINAAPDLKYIGVPSTAYAKVDYKYAESKDIPVFNVPGYSTESVAEFVFGMILDHIRELEEGKNRARKGNYSESGISASEIKNKVFGVVGLGRIGRRVAEIALGFGADVRYWSRNRKSDYEVKGIKYEDVDDLIPKCDFLSLHLAETEETKNFLNEKRIQNLKEGAIIINTAPMELVDVDALEKKLGKGDISFILDHSDEMSKEDLEKLSKHKNCVIYPPIGYVTKEATKIKQEVFVGNVENFLKKTPMNRVN